MQEHWKTPWDDASLDSHLSEGLISQVLNYMGRHSIIHVSVGKVTITSHNPNIVL